jgi:hypothetical protein
MGLRGKQGRGVDELEVFIFYFSKIWKKTAAKLQRVKEELRLVILEINN